jgi:putative redox protein
MNSVHCITEEPKGSLHSITVRAHELHADLTVAKGGQDAAPDAHDYFDASLAACKALTAVWYARRNQMPLEKVEAHVERDDSGERSGTYRLNVRLAFHGPLSDEERTRIYAAAVKCPVSKLMTSTEIVIETAPLVPSSMFPPR